MIFGNTKDLARYKGLSENMDKAIEFVLNKGWEALSNGSHSIYGQKVYVNIFEYETMEAWDVKWEAHRRYTDLHIVLDGKEKIGYADAGKVTLIATYDSEKDSSEYEGNETAMCILTPECFMITFPEDVHKPKIKAEEIQAVRKAVIKICTEI